MNASCEILLRFRLGAVLAPPSESFLCLRRGLRTEAPRRARCSRAMVSGAGEVDMLAHPRSMRVEGVSESFNVMVMPVEGWLMGAAFDCFFAMQQQPEMRREVLARWLAGSLHGVDGLGTLQACQADVDQ